MVVLKAELSIDEQERDYYFYENMESEGTGFSVMRKDIADEFSLEEFIEGLPTTVKVRLRGKLVTVATYHSIAGLTGHCLDPN
jgi:hypothetical protein